ncbi:MAG: ATP-binding protein [Acidimicrobiales bacterium]
MELDEPARLQLPAEPASISRSRRFVAETLEGKVDNGVLDTALVIMSELATNAMLHGQTGFEVVVRFDVAGLRLEVHDGSSLLPHRKHYSESSATGRGLVIVEALATIAGAEQTEDGKVVWAVLTELPPEPPVVAASDDEVPATPDPISLVAEPQHTDAHLEDLQWAAADDDPELRGARAAAPRELVPV